MMIKKNTFHLALISSVFCLIDLAISRPIFVDEAEAAGVGCPLPPEIRAGTPLASPLPSPVTAVFKPSIAVIVAVLTTMFSITFLLLLYAKHCKRGDGVVGYFGEAADLGRSGRGTTAAISAAVSVARNSGIDRAVVESLPVFRFGSLSGEKEGLECAVCLNRFDPVEVLRLLPKCKHAFHVECVDTWLDAHSTCPLCRCRVDPEDVLLVDDSNQNHPVHLEPEEIENPNPKQSVSSAAASARKSSSERTHRISGRHSYAGFSSSILNQSPIRRSYDGLNRKSEVIAIGCFDRHRKDTMLITAADREAAASRRVEHRIVISGDERWSDVRTSDLLYLRRDSVMNEGRLSSAAATLKRLPRQLQSGGDGSDGRVVNNGKSVSEITGLSRLVSNNSHYYCNGNLERQRQERERRAGAVSRWMAWISQSRPSARPRDEPDEAGRSNMKIILIQQQ